MFSLLNDEPVTAPGEDLLGTGRAAEHLSALLIASRDSTPFTLAVDAGWGMGKSSLMRLVDAELGKSADVHTVWYNAWTSNGADALEGLIKSVLLQFDRRILRRALHQVSERGALLRAVRALLVLLVGPLGVSGLVDELWRNLSVNAQARNEMRGALRDLAAEWAAGAGEHTPGRLLVVFIDDLDRCSEETVLAVCEAVKVYLDVPGLAFVIGCDRSALAPNGLLRDLSPAGTAFMEKVFQTNYRIPPPEGIDAYVRRSADKAGIGALLDDELVALLAERAARNPRRIKRLINGFVLEAELNPLWQDFGPEAVLRTLLLQHLYGDFYRVLVSGRNADAIREFLEYRAVRRLLRSPGEFTAEARQTLTRVLSEYEVPLGDEGLQGARADALHELERQLPGVFPALASDRAFVSLIDELIKLPDAAELVRRLRQRPLARPVTIIEPEDPPPSAPPPMDPPPPPMDPSPRAGMHVLWIDDHPETVASEVSALQRDGAVVEVVRTRAAAEDALLRDTPDLLISDVTRNDDREAGFTDLEVLRRTDRYTGPAIFYCGWVAPAREERAARLKALGLVSEPAALRELIDQVARERIAGPTVPPARPSGGRPR